jgi:SET domain-containing protein
MSAGSLPVSNRTGNSQTTDNRSENRSQEDDRRKHGHSDSTVHGIPHVHKDTGAVSEGCHGEEAT